MRFLYWSLALSLSLFGCATDRGHRLDEKMAGLSKDHRHEPDGARRHVEEAQAEVLKAENFQREANQFLALCTSENQSQLKAAYADRALRLREAEVQAARNQLELELARLKLAKVQAAHAEGSESRLSEAGFERAVDQAARRLADARRLVAQRDSETILARHAWDMERIAADVEGLVDEAPDAAQPEQAASETPPAVEPDKPAAEAPPAVEPEQVAADSHGNH